MIRWAHRIVAAVAVVLAACAAPAAAVADPGDPTGPTNTTAWLARVTAAADLHAAASDTSALIGNVPATTQWGGDTQLLVKESARTDGDLWLDVRVPGRPNGRHGWIRADKASLSTTPYRIEVRRSTKRLSLIKSGRTVKSIKVVVGAAATPTPSGYFAVADKLQLTDSKHFLGSWVLPLTAYSDVLHNFDGGIGQIALHGRGGASLLQPVGAAASHGCVRVENTQINRIAALVPTGTPVVII